MPVKRRDPEGDGERQQADCGRDARSHCLKLRRGCRSLSRFPSLPLGLCPPAHLGVGRADRSLRIARTVDRPAGSPQCRWLHMVHRLAALRRPTSIGLRRPRVAGIRRVVSIAQAEWRRLTLPRSPSRCSGCCRLPSFALLFRRRFPGASRWPTRATLRLASPARDRSGLPERLSRWGGRGSTLFQGKLRVPSIRREAATPA